MSNDLNKEKLDLINKATKKSAMVISETLKSIIKRLK